MNRDSSIYSARRYFPMLVSESGDEKNMSPEFLSSLWGRFDMLSDEKKDILTAGEIPDLIGNFQQKLQLDDSVVCEISLIIRKVFLGEIKIVDIKNIVEKVLTQRGGDINQAKVISDFIQNEILTIKPKPKVAEVSEEDAISKPKATDKLPLLQALSKYEQLGNQLITEERIKLRSQSETVRPSLLYWIKYYRDELGVGHHSSIERGNFLFRSENGKKLTPEERERVNLVLKSVEENYPVEIDTEQSVIVFPSFVAQPASLARAPQMMQPPMAPPKTSDARNVFSASVSVAPRPGTVSFTTNHVLPAEKEASLAPRPATPAPTSVPARPGASSAPQPAHQPNPFHIHPVSLGEKEE